MKKYLIITTALTTICFAPEIMAQCTESTDCASLGYTESSCPDGGLKCPLGNYWYCPGEQCTDDYQYTCTGTGYAGGSGNSCGGKYTSCTCADGYEWKDGTCQKEILKPEWGKCNGSAKNCNIGDILYSDGTCSTQNISGKTPIAVVVYKSDDGKCAQAMALKSIGGYRWSLDHIDIPTLTNFTSAESASHDLNSCSNTEKLLAAGNKNNYSAAWMAHEYKTEGTNAGDWCLPAAGVFTSYYNNQQLVYIGMTNANGANIIGYNWSSSEYGSDYAWASNFTEDYGLSYHYSYANNSKYNNIDVRPVLEF